MFIFIGLPYIYSENGLAHVDWFIAYLGPIVSLPNHDKILAENMEETNNRSKGTNYFLSNLLMSKNVKRWRQFHCLASLGFWYQDSIGLYQD